MVTAPLFHYWRDFHWLCCTVRGTRLLIPIDWNERSVSNTPHCWWVHWKYVCIVLWTWIIIWLSTACICRLTFDYSCTNTTSRTSRTRQERWSTQELKNPCVARFVVKEDRASSSLVFRAFCTCLMFTIKKWKKSGFTVFSESEMYSRVTDFFCDMRRWPQTSWPNSTQTLLSPPLPKLNFFLKKLVPWSIWLTEFVNSLMQFFSHWKCIVCSSDSKRGKKQSWSSVGTAPEHCGVVCLEQCSWICFEWFWVLMAVLQWRHLKSSTQVLSLFFPSEMLSWAFNWLWSPFAAGFLEVFAPQLKPNCKLATNWWQVSICCGDLMYGTKFTTKFWSCRNTMQKNTLM